MGLNCVTLFCLGLSPSITGVAAGPALVVLMIIVRLPKHKGLLPGDLEVTQHTWGHSKVGGREGGREMEGEGRGEKTGRAREREKKKWKAKRERNWTGLLLLLGSRVGPRFVRAHS